MAEQKILISIEIQDKNSKRVVDSTTASLGKLEESQNRVSKATDKTRATSGLNNAILMETSRLASDASFGFTAIANNLSQLINLFRMSKDATGGYMKSIKSLLKSSNLLLIGIQLLIAFLPRIIKRFQESTKQANALGKAFSDATAQITAQRTELLAYQGLLNSNNLSLAQKEKLIRKVRKETGLENIKLNENNQLNEYSNKLIAKKIQLMMLEAQANNVKKQVENVIAKREKELLEVREKQNGSLSKFNDFLSRKVTPTLSEYGKKIGSVLVNQLKQNFGYEKGVELLSTFKDIQKAYTDEVNSSEAVQSRKNKTDQEASEITEKYNKQLTPLLQTFRELVKQIALTEFQMGEYSDSIQKLSAISFKDFANANKEMRDMTKNFSAQLIDDELTRNQTLLALERDYYLQSIDQSIAAEEEKAKARAAVIAFFNQEIEQENLRHFSASLDLVEQSFNEETAIAKAALFVKQAIAMQELLLDIGVLKSKAKNAATEAGLDLVVAKKDVSAGGAKVAKTGNPLAIAAYALTAASIIANMIKAVKRVEEVSGASGGGAGGGMRIEAPDFNVVGASQTSQLAEVVSSQQSKPVKAFVVGKDISTQQELDRNTTNTASFG